MKRLRKCWPINSFLSPLFWLILFALFLLQSCGERPSLTILAAESTPPLIDMGQRDSLIAATAKHIEYLQSLPPDEQHVLGERTFTNSWLVNSTITFLNILQKKYSPVQQAEELARRFDIYQAGGRSGSPTGEMLVTGYYEPLIEGSLTRVAPFIYPLYRVPDDLLVKNIDGGKKVFRLTTDGTEVPYWSREVIEETNLLAGNELVYLKDPIDAFSIHVQGSSKILLPDGTIRSIGYAGSNGREYNSIGKLLADEGIMEREEVTMPGIRQYLLDNPEELKRVLYHNEKYIFFSWAATNAPPRGSTGVSLTAGRSIAIDKSVLPSQLPAFIRTRQPIINKQGEVSGWMPFDRFVLPQDSGSAIRGAGRVDIFWGNSPYAKSAAGNMKEKGALYFLVKKEEPEAQSLE